MEELQKLKSDSEVSMSFTSKCVYVTGQIYIQVIIFNPGQLLTT